MNTDSTTVVNPLNEFTRRESIYISIPSNGKFSKNNVKLTTSNELGIKPMTTADEISLTTPEALFNGEALVQVIKSCVPSINDPRAMLTPDIDAVLVGIRLASYGDEMEVSVKCPECKHENYFDSPIRQCIDNMKFLEDEYKIQLSDKVKNASVTVRPFTFDENIKEALFRFNETKALDMVIKKEFENDDELKEKYNEIVRNVSKNDMELVCGCIMNIYDSNGNEIIATDEQKLDWFKQLPSGDAKLIINKVSEINKIGINTTVRAQCQNCEHEWDSELSFDPTAFFGKGS